MPQLATGARATAPPREGAAALDEESPTCTVYVAIALDGQRTSQYEDIEISGPAQRVSNLKKLFMPDSSPWARASAELVLVPRCENLAPSDDPAPKTEQRALLAGKRLHPGLLLSDVGIVNNSRVLVIQSEYANDVSGTAHIGLRRLDENMST